MRLLQCTSAGKFSLTKDFIGDDEVPRYAILSHTWEEGQEVTYDDMIKGTGKNKSGYDKIRFCAQQAEHDGLRYFWIDTCCINKTDHVELQDAINSMFRWYRNATECYVHLSDVSRVDQEPNSWDLAFRNSRWFTRGWTLQELIAPNTVKFYSREGKKLGDKNTLERQIHEITGVAIPALQGTPLREFGVEERLLWAKMRRTTRKEDKAYSLLGIFGIFMPLLYGEGEEHAFKRLREEIDKLAKSVLQQQTSITTASNQADLVTNMEAMSKAPWLVPFPRPQSFIGRETPLAQLDTYISSERGQRVAIYGLGGCGKTALATELAYRTSERQPSCAIFWVPAVSRESFEQAYQEIGILLLIPDITDSKTDVKQLVKTRLSDKSFGQWLMIIDNADDTSVLFDPYEGSGVGRLIDYLPDSPHGSIVFTTRTRVAAIKMAESRVIALGELARVEAREVVKTRLLQEHQHYLEDEDAVEELLSMLAFLALAIVQAVAFVNTNDISLSDFILCYKKSERDAIDLLNNEFEDQGRYQETKNPVATTWYISFDQIRKRSELAVDYLSYMACMASNNIPASMLPVNDSQVEQIQAIGILKAYAFIAERKQRENFQGEAQEAVKAFDVHPLVHLAMQSWLKSHSQWATWVNKTSQRLIDTVPFGNYDARHIWTAYLPHTMHVADLAETCQNNYEVPLLERIGWCEQSLGRYKAAERVRRQVLRQREEVLGKEHPDTLASMNDVAQSLSDQGKYAEAEKMHQETLSLKEKVLGKKHPDTLISISNMAQSLSNQGKYMEAEKMHQEVLALRKKVLGKEHPHTLTSMNNVAQSLSNQGKYAEAEKMHRETLALDEKVSGKEHPDTLISISNIAQALSSQGKYAEAEKMHREILAVREKVLGKEHPDVLTSISSVAQSLSNRGNYTEAEKMHRKTLAVREKVLGKEHPDVLTSMNNVAQSLSNQGNYAEAEKMHRETLVLDEKVSGKEHPNTLISLSYIARALSNQGKYAEAEKMHRETLALREKVLGKEHPDVLTSMSNVAQSLNSQGKYAEAEKMHREILALDEKVSGKEHPSTLISRSYIARALSSQGKYAEAEKMHREILAVREKVLGKEHPDVLTSMSNVAQSLNSQGKYAEAEKMHRETLALDEKVSGKEHPDTLVSRSYIAQALSSQGKYAEAEKMHRETLAMREKVLGKEHPDTITSLSNIARTLSHQGQYAEAEKIHRQTLVLDKKVLGIEHPSTLSSMNNVAQSLNNQRKYVEAEEMHRETLALREKALGKECIDTYMSAYSLAHVLHLQHRYEDALPLYERARIGLEKTLGLEHPTTRACLNHYGAACQEADQQLPVKDRHGFPHAPSTSAQSVSQSPNESELALRPKDKWRRRLKRWTLRE